MSLTIEISGDDAEATTAELRELFRTEFGEDAKVHAAPPPSAGVTTRSDTMTLLTMILTIPPALLATLDIADRIKLKPKLVKLLDWARSKKTTSNSITIHSKELGTIELSDAQLDQVMEAWSRAVATPVEKRR
ncbi:MAG: hypothetical protein AAGC55_02735 [Myxococcota bacterium]